MTVTRNPAPRLATLRGCLRACCAAMVAALACAAAAPSASADVEWTSEILQAPTNLPPGGSGIVRIIGANEGDTGSTGFPTFSFELPPGVTINGLTSPFADANFWSCIGSPVVTCTNLLAVPFGFNTPAGTYVGHSGDATPGPYMPVNLLVDVAPGTPDGTYPFAVTLDGGGGSAVTTNHQVRIGSAQLPFGPTPGTFEAGAFDAAGNDYTQAGGHPYQASAEFDLNTRYVQPTPGQASTYGVAIRSEGNIKDAVVDIPPGFIGNPTAVTKCATLGDIANDNCSASSQVGVASISPPLNSGGKVRMFGVYNVVPERDAPAQFAFKSPVGTVVLTPVLRSDGDMGLSVKVNNVTQADDVMSSKVTLWGVPADPSHDAQRCPRPNFIAQACVGHDESNDLVDTEQDRYLPHPAGLQPRPFLTNPTACTGNQLITQLHVASWANQGSFEPDGDPNLSDPNWRSAQAAAPPVTGCDLLSFDPEITVTPTDATPGAPTGLEFELRVPQNDNPIGLASAHLKDTTVVLPEGMTVNPSSAGGLAACSSNEIGLTAKSPVTFTKLEPTCPLASKIGTVVVDTPLLDDPLTGDVFLARQTDNPFDSLLAMYIVVRGPGLLVKLAGHVQADAQTGRLTTTVLANPQVPFDSLRLRIKDGPRAPLTAPTTCGRQTVSASLTSWAGHSVQTSDSFTVNCPGTGDRFDPGFSAGSTGLVAGGFSPFVARITRDQGHKELGRIDVTLPKGLLASVKHVGVCTNAQVASSSAKAGSVTQQTPSCPSGSQIGTTTVGAGAGPEPFFPALPGSNATGRVFLTEAHRNSEFKLPGAEQADYGLAFEVPAVAGPFDLGTVMVRAAIYVDPETAQLVVLSDRLPRILQGIVLNVRDIRVNVDRPRFSVNPTSCAELRVAADIRAQDGTAAARSSRFQVGDCAALGLSPRVAMRIVGAKQTKLGGNPALRVRLRQGSGQANLRDVKAVLPRTLALDARNAGGDWLCAFEDGQRGSCPASSRIGTAKAFSPLLKRPLSGPVYFVKNVRRDRQTGNLIRTLPTLLVKLSGEADIRVRATSASRRGLLISTFKGLPDARVSRFDMTIRGGQKRGILAVTGKNANLCRGRQVTKLTMRGQNGKVHEQNVRMKTPCGKRRK